MTLSADVSSQEPPARPLVAGAVLSGGASRRMGRAKALLPWPPGVSSDTFLDVIVRTLTGAGVAPLCVVTGPHHEVISAHVASDERLELIHNARHAEAQLCSLWTALAWAEALEPCPDWLLVTLVDLPAVRPNSVRKLIDAAVRADAELAVRPVHAGRHGHPVLWRRTAWPLLRAGDPRDGARPIMRALARAARVLDVEVSDEGVLRDIDTPEEYRGD